MAKIIFLGTASSIPTSTRDNTSFLFIHKKDTLLIDCPGSVVQKLLKAGVDFKRLKNVIITHEHPDHIYGIIHLIHTQNYLKHTLNIFGNIHTIKIIKRLVMMFHFNKRTYPRINYIDVFKRHLVSSRKHLSADAAGFFYRRGDLKLMAFRNRHICDSWGLRFHFGKKSLVYTSDTRFSPKILQLAETAGYLIHDCTASSSYFKRHPSLYTMHTDAKTLTEHFQGQAKTKLIPIHFLLLREGEEERIRKELKPLGRKVIFVKDFQAISL